MGVETENRGLENTDEYYCSDCGKVIELIEESCPHCGAKFELPTKKFTYEELKEVRPFAKHFYFEIISRYPEWDKYAQIDSFEGQKFITIKIPSPLEDVFPIEITSYEEVPQEVTVHFGPSHIHMHMYKPFEQKFLVDQLDNVETIVQDIFDEELISIRTRKGFLGFFSSGMATVEKYKQLLDSGKLYRAVSWKGTYNYPKDGTHLDWELQDKSE